MAAVFVALLLASVAQALPIEDHWSLEADAELVAQFEKASLLIEEEQFAEAVPILEGLAVELPASSDVFNLLGFAYRNIGDLEKSAPAYERALYLKPRHLGALAYQGELFLLLDDIDGAEANLSRLEFFCAWPCEEREELAGAIDAWKAEHRTEDTGE
ncbi:MAG: tetratricopeptide repeat protein [Pseudomonadota bacterium]